MDVELYIYDLSGVSDSAPMASSLADPTPVGSCQAVLASIDRRSIRRNISYIYRFQQDRIFLRSGYSSQNTRIDSSWAADEGHPTWSHRLAFGCD